jgi:hypothetical protein
MTSRIWLRRTADCAPSIALEHAAHFLRHFETAELDADVRFPCFGWLLRRRVRLQFGIHIDDTDERLGREAIHFRWWAGAPWLPDLAGAIHFRIVSPSRTLLIFEGTYTPPFGIGGFVFDLFFGHFIARSTARDLLGRLAAAIEADERAYRDAHRVRA